MKKIQCVIYGHKKADFDHKMFSNTSEAEAKTKSQWLTKQH